MIIYGKGATGRMLRDSQPYWKDARLVDDADAIVTSGRFIVGIGYQHGGMNARRRELYELFKVAGAVFEVAHYLVTESANTWIGEGSAIMPGTVLHTHAEVGVNCFISSGVTIGHDVAVHGHSWVNAGVCIDGGAIIGEQCVIGSNAVIGAGVKLGERTLVFPGAVVNRDTPPGTVVVPAASCVHRFKSDVFVSVQS